MVQNQKGSGDDFIWQLIESSEEVADTSDTSTTVIPLARKVEPPALIKKAKFDAMGRTLAPARRTPRYIRMY